MPVSSWRDAFAVYTQARVLGMVFLGFSAGLPFLLVFSTLSAWLSDVGVERSLIGFFSWVGIFYSIKFFWAPAVDRLRLGPLSRLLGKRRSWMLLAQLGIAAGLFGMAASDARSQLEQLALLAVWVSFCSATQDIVIDAYRIEAVLIEFQGAMAAAYTFGYRIALLTAGAGAFYIAAFSSWSIAYWIMAALMAVGIVTTLLISEPEHRVEARTQRLEADLENMLGVAQHRSLWQRCAAGFSDAVLSPFVEFFRRNGTQALLILALIAVYKLSDMTMGVMANPFYLDLGFSKTEIADVSKIFGFFMTIIGAAVGGVLVARFGLLRPLLLGGVLAALTNVLFAWLAWADANLSMLALVISADNLSGGIAGAVFIAYLSSLTNSAYTATQYALFSSLMSLPGKLLGGLSGIAVDDYGYALFFIGTAAMGLPGIILVLWLIYAEKRN
ncbi:MAG: AmpG family muropeptide MFS transporter [Gammaproteobacteria bacterium]